MPRNAKNASRVARQRQHDARVNSWMAQFDVNQSGRLERPELAALLTHIHPQKEPPQERILDMLITQATEVRTYSMHLPGDPSGAVPFDKIMKVVNAFTAYTLASAAFDSIGAKGVLSLAELPSLISKANLSDDASAMSESEVGMLLGSAAGHTATGIGGELSDGGSVCREDVLRAAARWRYDRDPLDDFDEDEEPEPTADEPALSPRPRGLDAAATEPAAAPAAAGRRPSISGGVGAVSTVL